MENFKSISELYDSLAGKIIGGAMSGLQCTCSCQCYCWCKCAQNDQTDKANNVKSVSKSDPDTQAAKDKIHLEKSLTN